ncbi:MAG TPA: tetratricopeptide repeat protein [Crocinitomix sp.]|nr:tetratricopeptide repeat protein [Crocinitomix sp.]
MRNVFIVFIFLPTLVFSQEKYNLKSKKIFKQAQESNKSGNIDEALKLYEACLKEEPKYIEAYYNMSVIEYDNKNYDRAIKYCVNALKISKTKAPIHRQLAKSYFMIENYDSSAYYSKIATLLDPKSDESFYILAKSENNIKKYEKALNHINKAIDLNNTVADYFNVKGIANFGLENFDDAKTDFNKVIELEPGNTSVYKNLANVYIALDEPEKALENIDKGISSATGNEKIQYLLLKGNYYHTIGELDNAKASYEEAYKLNNQSPVVLTNMAAVMIDKSKFEEAVQYCDKAIELDPTMTEAYFNRGIANEMLRKTNEACADWEEAFILGAVKAEEFLNSPTCNE